MGGKIDVTQFLSDFKFPGRGQRTAPSAHRSEHESAHAAAKAGPTSSHLEFKGRPAAEGDRLPVRPPAWGAAGAPIGVKQGAGSSTLGPGGFAVVLFFSGFLSASKLANRAARGYANMRNP